MRRTRQPHSRKETMFPAADPRTSLDRDLLSPFLRPIGSPRVSHCSFGFQADMTTTTMSHTRRIDMDRRPESERKHRRILGAPVGGPICPPNGGPSCHSSSCRVRRPGCWAKQRHRIPHACGGGAGRGEGGAEAGGFPPRDGWLTSGVRGKLQ